MPVFYLLIILGCILVWFLLAGLFKPIGRFFSALGRDAIENMIDDENKNSEETKEN